MNVRSKTALWARVLGLAAASLWPHAMWAKADDAVWLTSFEEGQRAARASGKPLFVVFRCER